MSRTLLTISEKLRETEQLFSKAGISSPRLDAEVLLAYTLGVTRSYLHAHATEPLHLQQGFSLLQGKSLLQKFEKLVERRLRREPIAYIVGKKEFYGREFIVTPDVLIPRPETEELVELVLRTQNLELRTRVLDVGCGSGCIGITLKLERPELGVTLCDISPAALSVAKRNAEKLNASVEFDKSDLLSRFLPPKIQNLKSKISFDIIIANLPYVDTTWETSPETSYEPREALYADSNGYALIFGLIDQSASILRPGGLLALEADPEQHERIIERALTKNFTLSDTRGYAMSFVRQA